MLTVLMIDDDADVIATVRDHLTATFPDVVFHGQDFDAGFETLRARRPDVLILDWYRGNPATGETAGAAGWSVVWNEWFCPIVIYTAGEVEFAEQPPEDHPFIRIVAKGADTERTVADHITSYSPHIDALRQVGDEISRVTQAVLRNLAAPLFSAEHNDQRRREILVRAARRRVAAMMDDAASFGGEMAHAWEMYVFPVLTDYPITGDILRLSGGDASAPGSYRVVLTPTCDMVPQGAARACKVAQVLAARCCAATHFAEKGMSLARNTGVNKVKEKLPVALNESHQSGFVLLPQCPGTIPIVAVNLRDLELIPVASIGNGPGEGKDYLRIASLDSPFREQFVWAYLQIGCRPGLPPRDMRSLIDSFAEQWTANPTDGQ